MKKVVLYKRLSAPLMERLRERVEVLLVEEPGRDGLARLRDALPEAHGLLGASLRLDAGLLDLAPRLEAIAASRWASTTMTSTTSTAAASSSAIPPTCSPRPPPTPASR